MKVAVIIKHPGRDFDFRVDFYEVPGDASEADIKRYAQSQMLGPFEVIAVTGKLSDTTVELQFKQVQILEKVVK